MKIKWFFDVVLSGRQSQSQSLSCFKRHMHIPLFFYLSILLLNNYNRKERVKGVRNDFFFQLRLRLETVAWVVRLLLRGFLPSEAGDYFVCATHTRFFGSG